MEEIVVKMSERIGEVVACVAKNFKLDEREGDENSKNIFPDLHLFGFNHL